MKPLFISICISLFFFKSFAANQCSDLLASSISPNPRLAKNFHPFWSTTEQVLINIDGISFPLTYSFDSEIPTVNWLGMIHTSPRMREAFENATSELETLRLPRTKEQLSKIFNLSVKQFQSFALRKSVDKNKASFDLWDLNPNYLDILIEKFVNLNERNELAESMSPSLRETVLEVYGLQTNSEIDGIATIELQHALYSDVPIEFARQISTLHRVFSRPQTHLHIGIPASIGEEKALAIARAVETKVVFDLAMKFEVGENNLVYSSGTNLRHKPIHDRGPVFLKLNEFDEPFIAHDLEIRQWPNITEGMNLLALASQLVQAYQYVRVFEMSKMRKVYSDGRVGNLKGALEYASLVLRDNADPRISGIAARLLEFSQEIRTTSIPDALISQIGTYISENNVNDLLNLEVFLEQPR